MSRFLDMIIKSLRSHWPARKMEWMMTILVFQWGLYMLLHPGMFTDPATRQPLIILAQMAERYGFDPATLWGGLALAMAVLRGAALLVNGAYARTPIGRLVAAFGSMFVFTQVSIALYRSGVPNLGLMVYPWLVSVDLMSAYRAGEDAIIAESQRRKQKGTISAAVPSLSAE